MSLMGQKQPPNDARSDSSFLRERTPRYAIDDLLLSWIDKQFASTKGERLDRSTRVSSRRGWRAWRRLRANSGHRDD
jgi:hypothetical protein